jgi:hypothetical protein
VESDALHAISNHIHMMPSGNRAPGMWIVKSLDSVEALHVKIPPKKSPQHMATG